MAQKKDSLPTLGLPMNIPLISAGSFGELRDNHFHAGLDLKTQYREGIPVYATEDGYVSRIKIAVWGYGKALYINHPNGYTTVYGHLSKFSPEIEAHMKNLIYQKQKHELQDFPEETEFPIKKGQLIAYSGSTGGFVGPHLHYEVRDTKTEHILNPLSYGIPIEDHTAPKLLAIMVKPGDSSSFVNGLQKAQKLNITKLKNRNYRTAPVNIQGKGLFQVQAYDIQNSVNNKNGIYQISTYINDSLIYNQKMQEFSFAESKQINLLIDYQKYNRSNQRYQQLYIPESSSLSVYDRTLKSNGLVQPNKSNESNYKIVLEDYSKNKTNIYIPIVYDNSPKQIIKEDLSLNQTVILKDKFYLLENKNTKIALQKNSFFDDVSLNITQIKDSIFMDEDRIALNKSFSIAFKIPKDSIAQLGIVRVDLDGKKSFIKSEYKNQFLTAYTKTLGTYTLAKDSIAPKVSFYNFKDGQWISKYKTLKIKISDQDSGIYSYEAFMDGNWMALSFNPKTNLITYDLKDIPLEGSEHTLEIFITDLVGNQSNIRATLYNK
ncbi:MAG: M23 family metallopeptidase [Flavobacteriaceae bacterium]